MNPGPAIPEIDVGQDCMCAPQMSAILPKTADFMPSITANPRIGNELEAILWYAWHGQLLDKQYQSPVHPLNSRSSQLSPLDSNCGRLSPTSLTNTLVHPVWGC